MFVTLGAAIVAGSFGFCRTIEASPHNNIVYMDAGEQQPSESEYHTQETPQQDDPGNLKQPQPPTIPY